MTDTTQPGPFGRAAQIYRAAGWLGTIPLGREPGKKGPPLSGFTGHDGRYPDGGDIGTWLSSPLAAHNIGLRMPPGVIGLDIDAGYTKVENGKEVVKRGEDTLRDLEAKWGPLPPTWVSSARPAPSGIRFFRVPETLGPRAWYNEQGSWSWECPCGERSTANLPREVADDAVRQHAGHGRPVNWPGEAGKFIEIIQPGHRYAVVWPSTNPDAEGRPYLWTHPDDDPLTGDGADRPPRIEYLAPLPDAWVRGLALDYARTEKADLGHGDAGTWFRQLRQGDPCPNIHSVTSKAIAALGAVDGSRHETARDALAAVVLAGASGHRGAPGAVAALHAHFVAAVGEARANGGEWQRLAVGAVQLAATDNPVPRQTCSHDIPAATVVALPDGFMAAIPAPPPLPGSTPQLSEADARSLVDAAIDDVMAMPADQRDDAVRRLPGDLIRAGVPEADLLRARAELTSRSGASGVKLGEWDAVVTATRRQMKDAAKAAAAAQAHQAAQQRLAEAQTGGTLLPPPYAPMDVAEQLIQRLPAPARWWRGDFYLWDGTRYVAWAPEAVDNWLYQQTSKAQFDAGGDKGPEPWRPDEAKIGKLSHALSRGLLYRPSHLEPDDAPNLVACTNGIYNVDTQQLLPHSPDRFNLASVPFPYDPQAKAPLWEWFLGDVLPADAQQLLQEWFGYMVSGRTDMEKILHMQGLPRSGKGTVATVLEHLLGESAVASPSMPSLVGTFGEQPLIGKTMALMSDINWSFRDIVEGVEIVKKISGRDTRDVNRKNRDVWHGKLAVRFVIMGNDLPKFTDASGALAYRMLHIQFPGTVQGREDTTVKDRLLDELPGILNWALTGLQRLATTSRFTEPQSAAELASDVRRQQSPVQGFLDDACVRANDDVPPVPLDELFPVYRAWAREADVAKPLDREWFSRALSSAGVKVKRSMINGVKARRIHGLVPALTQIEGRGAVSEWAALLNPELRTPVIEAPPGFMPQG